MTATPNPVTQPVTPTDTPSARPLTGLRAAACLAESIRSLQRVGTAGAHAVADALRPFVARIEALTRRDGE